ncbi:MAG TPA: hypothetical protein VFM29_02220, partial [Vicinamibacteria bacterium]|nr:hypothetical protein [Vicinamibacteria bacterium]
MNRQMLFGVGMAVGLSGAVFGYAAAGARGAAPAQAAAPAEPAADAKAAPSERGCCAKKPGASAEEPCPMHKAAAPAAGQDGAAAARCPHLAGQAAAKADVKAAAQAETWVCPMHPE